MGTTVVWIDLARQQARLFRATPSIISCPATQCDILVKVLLRRRDGEKVPLPNVQVAITGTAHAAATGTEGMAKFVGYVPVGGREEKQVTVTLQGGDVALYAWLDTSSAKVKGPPFAAGDSMTKTLTPNKEILYYFEVAEQVSILEIEVNRYDNRRLPARVQLSVIPDPRPGGPLPPIATRAETTLYRGIRVTESETKRKWKGLKKGTEFHSDRIVLEAPPGQYQVSLLNSVAVRGQQQPAAAAWTCNPDGATAVTVDVPVAGEARVIYTLSRYTHVQCISFLLQVGAVGNPILAEDIRVRCDIMKRAIEQALPNADPSPNVLKVFMAPEFYFQGPQGCFPLDLVEGIMPEMRRLLKSDDYEDWVFVMGTAIGGFGHTQPPQPYRLRITNVAGTTITVAKEPRRKVSDASVCGHILNIAGFKWKVTQGPTTADVTAAAANANGSYALTMSAAGFANGPCLLTQPGTAGLHILRVTVIDAVNNILTVSSGRDSTACCGDVTSLWRAWQPGANELIERAVRGAVSGTFDLHMAGAVVGFVNGPVYLEETFDRTEVFNIALVAKGGADPANPGGVSTAPVNRAGMLRETLVYKEWVSSVDYTAPVVVPNWFDPTGAGRRVMFGAVQMTVQGVQGSRDALGGMDSVPETTGQSELQRGGGLGGGSVFEVDGVTFGTEVCLDHAYGKLYEFYMPTKGAKSGDRFPQLQLIPSCGMNIGTGPICCEPGGLIFNVDGGSYLYVVLRLNDGSYSCDKHIAMNQAGPGECAGLANEHEHFYYCRQPHNHYEIHQPMGCWCGQPHDTVAPGTCSCGTALQAINGGGYFECPRYHRVNSTHYPGACWCGQNHGGARTCACGSTLLAGTYHYCPKPHNLGGAHFGSYCWCGGTHTTALPGPCACGQTLVDAGGSFLCPREHTMRGLHDAGACWCTGNHTVMVPGNCACGAPYKISDFYACPSRHNQAVFHSEGRCGCGQTHNGGAPGACAVCTRTLVEANAYACGNAHAQAVCHESGTCQAVGCAQAHTSGVPGQCPDCDLALASKRYYYCADHDLIVVHPEVGCVCGHAHSSLSTGNCGTCNRVLHQRSHRTCVSHGVQVGVPCGVCGVATTEVREYYCSGSHNVGRYDDRAGTCATCAKALLSVEFYSCPGLHNQLVAVDRMGNCGTCGDPLVATPYYACTADHNQTTIESAAGNCVTCNAPKRRTDYFYCDRTHGLIANYAPAFAGAICVGCTGTFVPANFYYCPEKHGKRVTDDNASNCPTCTGTPARLLRYEVALKKIGLSILPSWGPTPVNIGGISDSNGPVAWDDYFKLGGGYRMNDGRIAVYPIRALPAGTTV